MKSFGNESHLVEVLRLVEQVIPENPQRIIDVGCGDGIFSVELGKILKAKEILGVDISPNAVKEAISRTVYAKVLDIDEGDLPFESDYFDFIFCGNLIELVLDPDHLLEELYRVLSHNGHLVITFPNLCAWASRIAVLLGFHPYYDRTSRRYDFGKLFTPITRGDSTGFIRSYCLRSFKQMVELYGFEVIQIRGAKANGIPKFISFFDSILSKIPSLTFRIICIVKKAQITGMTIIKNVAIAHTFSLGTSQALRDYPLKEGKDVLFIGHCLSQKIRCSIKSKAMRLCLINQKV